MKKFSPGQTSPFAGLFCSFVMALALTASATVLDNFNDNVKSGWTDTIAGGSITEAAQRFNITTAGGGGSLTFSRKTSASHTNANGRTLEFRVDVTTANPAPPDTNALAILGWVPTGGNLLAAGYSVSVGANDVKVMKGASTLYATNVAIQNTNIAIVLRMTTAGASVTVRAQVYKLGNGLLQLVFDRTIVDGSGLVVAGNAALGVLNQNSGGGVSASFDNLQVFEMVSGVLDDFSGPNVGGTPTSVGWTVAGSGRFTNSAGQAHVYSAPGPATTFEAGAKTTQTFKIVDGVKVEFQIDVVNNVNQVGTFAVIDYIPSLGGLASLKAYHVAADTAQVFNGKEFNRWWYGTAPPFAVPPANYRLLLAMTGEGTSIRLDSRIEDLGVADVNDPARLLYQFTFLDTAGNDPGIGGTPDSATGGAAYTNANGFFSLYSFNGGNPAPAYMIFDNALFTQTVPGNAPPINTAFSPADGATFASAGAGVSFNVVDDNGTPSNNIVLTLNGVAYSNGLAGVTVSGPTNSRVFTLTGVLAANAYYTGTARSTDGQGAVATTTYVFDTFLTNNLILESEEYNFNSGSYIDNPLLIAEGGSDPGAYNDQPGTPEVDFHDNRASIGGDPEEHTFRINDNVRTAHTGDGPRAKYVNAGGAAANFFEQQVVEVENGDWLNYTHMYPTGTYNVFLRHAQYFIPQTLTTLDRVTSDPTMMGQTTAPLGCFLGVATGFDQHRLVPLTDVSGQSLMVLRMSNVVETLRLSDRIASISDSELFQNYVVFVPVADPGVLRPIVSMSTPPANYVIDYASPPTSPFARIANRDTTVNTGSVLLFLNGVATAKTVTPTAGGADVTWSFGVLPTSQTITNTLVFQDSDSVFITNTWIYSFASFLRAANSIAVGSLSSRGVDTRMVYTNGPGLGNSLGRAEQQLTYPPSIPYIGTITSILQTLNWNDAGGADPIIGLTQDGSHDNIAIEMFTYLELTAGVHRFHAISDDRFQLRSGSGLSDIGGVVFGQALGNTFNGTFDFMVEAAGLYPVRGIWEENTGGANFALFHVNLSDNSEFLVNDPGDPVGVVKAYYPYVCVSSTVVTGPYTADTSASFSGVSLTGGTVTVPISGAAKFYRIDGLRQTQITSAVKVGPNLVLTYTVP